MRFIQPIIILSTIALLSNPAIGSTKPETENALSKAEYIDTKYKSADGQFEIPSIGIFTELPIYNKQNEKIKNILYCNKDIAELSKDSLIKIKDVILNSGYKYDSIFISSEDNNYLHYNPFTDEYHYGIIKDDKNLEVIKKDSL